MQIPVQQSFGSLQPFPSWRWICDSKNGEKCFFPLRLGTRVKNGEDARKLFFKSEQMTKIDASLGYDCDRKYKRKHRIKFDIFDRQKHKMSTLLEERRSSRNGREQDRFEVIDPSQEDAGRQVEICSVDHPKRAFRNPEKNGGRKIGFRNNGAKQVKMARKPDFWAKWTLFIKFSFFRLSPGKKVDFRNFGRVRKILREFLRESCENFRKGENPARIPAKFFFKLFS